MVEHLDKTMDTFSNTVTLQQTQLLENISQRIGRTTKQEFFSEFLEMRKVMGRPTRPRDSMRNSGEFREAVPARASSPARLV